MKVNIYLNFNGQAEEAFTFYRSVFGGEFIENIKMGDAPNVEKLPEDERKRTMHISLPLSSNTILMASDTVPSMGHVLKQGNNSYISIHPKSKEEADRLFNGLSENGKIEMPMETQFWGDYYGSFTDKFGIHWMINFNKENS